MKFITRELSSIAFGVGKKRERKKRKRNFNGGVNKYNFPHFQHWENVTKTQREKKECEREREFKDLKKEREREKGCCERENEGQCTRFYTLHSRRNEATLGCCNICQSVRERERKSWARWETSNWLQKKRNFSFLEDH